MPPKKILCIAEKPSIAKAVSQHMSGGQTNVRTTKNKYIKNYDFTYLFAQPWGECAVTMTSVLGHTVEWDFDDAHRKWNSCAPGALFEARTVQVIGEKTKDVATNITHEARNASMLFIWTDCDREGEYIGTEVRDIALKANPRIMVKRARFSNIERAHILHAAQNPIDLDERQAAAVSARIELDLRIGAAFTRWQTTALKAILGSDQIVSYGSCQFPTLGFVVDRYHKIKNFVAEPFWYIKVMQKRDDIHVTFNWNRSRLFDRMSTVILFERCLLEKYATVISTVSKPARKLKPLPLTTVELQKQGSRLLGLSSQLVMTIAEKLYISGFISYPRTETDQFDKAIDLRALVDKQIQSESWGQFAQGLMDGGFSQPCMGKNNDKAHPPIHPVAFVAPSALATADERKVYELITRRFLACCSEDAIGETTTVNIKYGDEHFHTSGLIVRKRNYLDVYIYEKWVSSQILPKFRDGERFIPTEANITEGKTSPPAYLTEPELIALMDANGIGTDATMADHIARITERMYVFAQPKTRGAGGGGGDAEEEMDNEPAAAGRGRGRGHGRGGAARGGGRGGAAAGGGRGGMLEFIPSNLGIALVEGYDKIGFDNSLSKPFLRKEMEEKMKRICEGTMTRGDVVHSSLEQYRDMFIKASRQVGILQESARKYLGP
ncbi:DNA topoisomerase [Morchella conica CCBAS932]|uniref:DNA topoisomerase n=1 Tax=Morchella conica CCBAS932 TaxID=1392247 RepID=A0A3N4L161_9PEZI|nr:DNA topoisomerase [Morchella conica CCBAS932]